MAKMKVREALQELVEAGKVSSFEEAGEFYTIFLPDGETFTVQVPKDVNGNEKAIISYVRENG